MSFTELEGLVIETLSFYEPMTLPKIILSLSDESLKKHSTFNQDDLELILKNLKKRGLVKCSKLKGQKTWIRIHPKSSLWKKFMSFLSALS